MKSEIIDRILSENSEPLHKIIETVKRGLTEIFLNSPLLSLTAILRDL